MCSRSGRPVAALAGEELLDRVGVVERRRPRLGDDLGLWRRIRRRWHPWRTRRFTPRPRWPSGPHAPDARRDIGERGATPRQQAQRHRDRPQQRGCEQEPAREADAPLTRVEAGGVERARGLDRAAAAGARRQRGEERIVARPRRYSGEYDCVASVDPVSSAPPGPVTAAPTAYVPATGASISPANVSPPTRVSGTSRPTRSAPVTRAVAVAPSPHEPARSTVIFKRSPTTVARTVPSPAPAVGNVSFTTVLQKPT